MKITEILKQNPTLYHLSDDNKLSSLSPKIPKKLQIRTNAFEDTTIPRVSFSETIEGCILGIQLSENEFTEKTFYIYSPTNYHTKFLSNQDIIKQKLVFDAKITKEWWALEEIDVKLIGEVIIINEIIKTIEYTPIRIGNPKFLKANGKLDTFLYKFKINKY